MKKTKTLTILFSLLTAITILFTACCKDGKPCRENVTRVIPISSEILGIIIEGPWDVFVTQDITKNDATIDYPTCYENKVTATLHSNGYLHIKVRGSLNTHHNRLTATINATDLEKIEGSGATTIRTTGPYTGKDISLSGASTINEFLCEGNATKITLSGASTLKNFTFTGNSMRANLSGASKLKCEGYAAEISFSGSGASTFNTLYLESENMDVDFSGASYGEITVNKCIKGELSGASTLKYKNATDVSGVHLSGASELIRLD